MADEMPFGRVERGIRRHRYGLEAYVHGGGRQIFKRFKRDTPLAAIRLWRQHTKSNLELEARLQPQRERLKRSERGWCYIYFIRAGGLIKIGRAVDPWDRLRRFQTGHGEILHLVAAIPAHAVLEPAIQQRFAHLRTNGEWFEITDELIAFIDRIKAGENPVPLIW